MNRVHHFIHQHLLKILILVYLLAAFFPTPGQWLRDVGTTALWVGTKWQMQFSLLQVFLGFLLFNAGASCRFSELKKTLKHPGILITGVLFNFLAPVAFIALFSFVGKRFWHNPNEIQNILAGLTILASMPIAGSSAAWVQESGGNTSLILGLVTLTTLLSPFSTPFIFHTVIPLLSGDYAEDLSKMSHPGGIQIFLLLSVVVPSLMGMSFRHWMSESTYLKTQPGLKLAGILTLILLNYSNAASALPVAFSNPDWDFLLLILGSTLILCFFSFSAGWLIPVLFRAKDSERKALTFGLGMNNNGTGLVLTSVALPDHPLIALPILFYNLGQQVIAGIFFNRFQKSPFLDRDSSGHHL